MFKPIVSICCTTYNHVEYIKEALDGFLMQKTNFKFEICIGEDESSDGTREICIDYSKKYPDIIKLFLRQRKDVMYIHGYPTGRYNFIQTLNMCEGKYIAFCEGDDYWIDPYKLQKQVDFLEKKNDYGMVFTDGSLLYMDSNRFISSRYRNENVYTDYVFEHLIKKNYISTLTVCAHKKLLDQGIEILSNKKWLMGDYPLWLSIAKTHKIGFINEITSVHRFLKESASRTDDIHKKIKFVKSDFEIKIFFLNLENDKNNYRVMQVILKVLKEKLLLIGLNYKSYKLINLELSQYKIEYNFLDYLYIFGSKNIIFWLLIKFIRYIFPRYKY